MLQIKVLPLGQKVGLVAKQCSVAGFLSPFVFTVLNASFARNLSD